MKKAFTLIELIFVLVVIGIIATFALPKLGKDTAQIEAIKLANNIRYVQHLAMMDDKFNVNNSTWFRNRWLIDFNGNSYSMVSDNNATFAKNPINTKLFLQNIVMENVNAVFSGGCLGKSKIAFDNLGRPIVGEISSITSPYVVSNTPINDGQLLLDKCLITITNTQKASDVKIVSIEPETGHVSIQ